VVAFFTYIMASKPYATLYVGSTDDIWQRVLQHREMTLPGFTQKYNVTRLAWVEVHGSRHEAFRRERQIKEWRRAWKIELIETMSPGWVDLSDHFESLVLH
jgi:putative endonuclease